MLWMSGRVSGGGREGGVLLYPLHVFGLDLFNALASYALFFACRYRRAETELQI